VVSLEEYKTEASHGQFSFLLVPPELGVTLASFTSNPPVLSSVLCPRAISDGEQSNTDVRSLTVVLVVVLSFSFFVGTIIYFSKVREKRALARQARGHSAPVEIRYRSAEEGGYGSNYPGSPSTESSVSCEQLPVYTPPLSDLPPAYHPSAQQS